MTRLIDIPEIAQRLGVCEAWVRARILSGELHGAKFGQRWKVLETEVDRFIAARIAQRKDASDAST